MVLTTLVYSLNQASIANKPAMSPAPGIIGKSRFWAHISWASTGHTQAMLTEDHKTVILYGGQPDRLSGRIPDILEVGHTYGRRITAYLTHRSTHLA